MRLERRAHAVKREARHQRGVARRSADAGNHCLAIAHPLAGVRLGIRRLAALAGPRRAVDIDRGGEMLGAKAVVVVGLPVGRRFCLENAALRPDQVAPDLNIGKVRYRIRRFQQVEVAEPSAPGHRCIDPLKILDDQGAGLQIFVVDFGKLVHRMTVAQSGSRHGFGRDRSCFARSRASSCLHLHSGSDYDRRSTRGQTAPSIWTEN